MLTYCLYCIREMTSSSGDISTDVIDGFIVVDKNGILADLQKTSAILARPNFLSAPHDNEKLGRAAGLYLQTYVHEKGRCGISFNVSCSHAVSCNDCYHL